MDILKIEPRGYALDTSDIRTRAEGIKPTGDTPAKAYSEFQSYQNILSAKQVHQKAGRSYKIQDHENNELSSYQNILSFDGHEFSLPEAYTHSKRKAPALKVAKTPALHINYDKWTTEQLKRALTGSGVDISWVKDRSNLISLAQEAFGTADTKKELGIKAPPSAFGTADTKKELGIKAPPSTEARHPASARAVTRTTALAALAPESPPQPAQGILISPPPRDGTALAREWSAVWTEAQRLESAQRGSSSSGAEPADGQHAIILAPPPRDARTPFEQLWRGVWDDAQRLQRAAAPPPAARAAAPAHPVHSPAPARAPPVPRQAPVARPPPAVHAAPHKEGLAGAEAAGGTEEGERAADCAVCLRRWSPGAFECAVAACPAPSELDQEQVLRRCRRRCRRAFPRASH